MKINLRESLNKLDLQTDNKYDLRNTYDCNNISDDNKKKLAKALNKNASAKTISEILNESLEEAKFMEPEYEDGDVVFVGDANGYHGTFLIKGDFRNIPEELYHNIRKVTKYGNLDKPYYKVEYKIDSDHLFEEDYREFFEYIIPILKDAGIDVLRSEKDINNESLDKDTKKLKTINENVYFIKKKYDRTGRYMTYVYNKNKLPYEDLYHIAEKYKLGIKLPDYLNYMQGHQIPSDVILIFSPEKIDNLSKAFSEINDNYSSEEIKNIAKEQGVLDYNKSESLDRNVLDYDDEMSDTWLDLFDIASPQEVANNFKKDVKSKNKIYKPIKDESLSEDLTEANYGGAYDIEDDMYFTKEELVEFANDMVDNFSDWSHHKCGLEDVYMTDPKHLVIDVYDYDDGVIHRAEINIDMRKIRTPKSIYNYEQDIITQWQNAFDEYHDYNESLNEEVEEQLYKVVIKNGPNELNFESNLSYEDAQEIVDYYNGRWIDEEGYKWSMEIEEDELEESLNESSKPDFVVGFYAGQVDDETLELINPEKLVEVSVSADELKERYGKDAEKLLNDYTIQTADRLKNSSSMLNQMILQTAEQKARYSGKLTSKFEEVKERLGNDTYMDRKIEEINYPFRDGIKDLSKKLGKMLLPKRENLNKSLNEGIEDLDSISSTKAKDMSDADFKVLKSLVDEYLKDRKALGNWPDSVDERNFVKKWYKLADKCKEIVKNGISGITGYGRLNDFIKIKILELARSVDNTFPWYMRNQLEKFGELSESLKEDIEDEIDFEESDFDDGEVEEGATFIEDGTEWCWIERIAGPIHLDFDNWAVWSARNWDQVQYAWHNIDIETRKKAMNSRDTDFFIEVINSVYDEAEVAYFVVDEDTGFIDWGPVETSTEAQDFLNSKVEDYKNDEEYEEIEIEEESLHEKKEDSIRYFPKLTAKETSFFHKEGDWDILGKENSIYDVNIIAYDRHGRDGKRKTKSIEDNDKEFLRKYGYTTEKSARNSVRSLEDKFDVEIVKVDLDNLQESLTESRAIRNDGDYEITLHYDDIGNGKEYDYTLGYDEVVDYLRDIAWANGDGPEDLNEDEYLEWVMDNFDELTDKYELNILNYFESEASQYEYDHRYDEP